MCCAGCSRLLAQPCRCGLFSHTAFVRDFGARWSKLIRSLQLQPASLPRCVSARKEDTIWIFIVAFAYYLMQWGFYVLHFGNSLSWVFICVVCTLAGRAWNAFQRHCLRWHATCTTPRRWQRSLSPTNDVRFHLLAMQTRNLCPQRTRDRGEI